MTRDGKRGRSVGVALAGSPAHACSFDLGHVRQDVYACLKCAPKGGAGFCSSCKFACHAGHLEYVVDLYSKRGFRCDCGNEAMGNKCALEPSKPPSNPGNAASYSHNFLGRYCRCDRPYTSRSGEMTQCALCEDWYHSKCLLAAGLSKRDAVRIINQSALELICRSCANRLPVLYRYYATLGLFQLKAPTKVTVSAPASEGCIAPSEEIPILKNFDLLWTPNFRASLCTCRECLGLYKEAGLPFIADVKDFNWQTSDEETPEREILDSTKDSVIVREVLAEGTAEGHVKRRRKNDARDIFRLEGPAGDANSAETTGDDSSLVAARAANQFHENDHYAIQSRIRDFLERSVETSGRNMTQTTLRTYLADIKTEVVRAQEAGDASK